MRVSDMIEELEHIQRQHGDVDMMMDRNSSGDQLAVDVREYFDEKNAVVTLEHSEEGRTY